MKSIRPILCVVAALALAGGAYALGAWRAKRPENVVAEFHRLFHKRGAYQNTRWMGKRAQKCPLDLWVFQEIVHETRPDVVVEMGTFHGGSALYFASLFDLIGRGRVITVDIEDQPDKPQHPRIQYLLGSSTSPEIVSRVQALLKPGEKVMVVLDSDHHGDHVSRELRLYSGLVTPGCYLIVEDTHFNGNPILPNFGPGPMEAVRGFLAGNANFEVDRSREKFLMTFNPSGYIRRLR